jgi:hypothetical protein
LLGFFASARAVDQREIDFSQAADHVGEYVVVVGVVSDAKVSSKGNAFLNFGGRFPNHVFTGFVPAGNPLATDPWLMSLNGKRIRIEGIVELYRGKPEIKITSRGQISE